MTIIKKIFLISLIIAGCIVLVITVAGIFNTLSTFSEKQTDAYNGNYETAYAQSFDTAYREAYDRFYAGSYEESYQTSYDAGYRESYDEQYKPAYDKHYQTAYNESYQQGYDTQYEIDYAAQYATGNEEGYETGFAAGNSDGLETQVSLHNPTYQELLRFLTKDHTDMKPFHEVDYNCFNYSADVNNNAEAAGIRAAVVFIYYPQEPGHAIVAFETTDAGLIYIEPQSDSRVKLVLGKHYYRCIVPESGYYYTAPSYDDTVMEIVIAW